MHVDHLTEFNQLMPDRLKLEWIKIGDLPIRPLSFEKMRLDIGCSEASARNLFQSNHAKASDPKRLLKPLS